MKNSSLLDLSRVIERTGKALLVIASVTAVLFLAKLLLELVGGSSLHKMSTSIFYLV